MMIPKIFVDSSIFLKFFFKDDDKWGQSEATKILSHMEKGSFVGYVTPMVLEEVTFKLTIAVASDILGTKNVWRIREALLSDKSLRAQVIDGISPWIKFLVSMIYIGSKGRGGLRVVSVDVLDWFKAMTLMREHGLLSADAMHAAVALRLGAQAIATFDTDFCSLKQRVKVIPTDLCP